MPGPSESSSFFSLLFSLGSPQSGLRMNDVFLVCLLIELFEDFGADTTFCPSFPLSINPKLFFVAVSLCSHWHEVASPFSYFSFIFIFIVLLVSSFWAYLTGLGNTYTHTHARTQSPTECHHDLIMAYFCSIRMWLNFM